MHAFKLYINSFLFTFWFISARQFVFKFKQLLPSQTPHKSYAVFVSPLTTSYLPRNQVTSVIMCSICKLDMRHLLASNTFCSLSKNMVTQDTDMVTQDTDMVTQDTDMVTQDTDMVTQDTNMVTQDTNMVTQDTEWQITRLSNTLIFLFLFNPVTWNTK